MDVSDLLWVYCIIVDIRKRMVKIQEVDRESAVFFHFFLDFSYTTSALFIFVCVKNMLYKLYTFLYYTWCVG